MASKQNRIKVCFVGFGRTASHLFYALNKTSGAVLSIGAKNSGSKYNRKNISESDVIFICTPDAKIGLAVSKLIDLQIEFMGKVIFHTSGAKNSDELIGLKECGASTASFHPVQTFNTKATRNTGTFERISVAIEGDIKAVKTGFKIARMIGSRPIEIDKHSKVRHHIYCVFMSNYITSMIDEVNTDFLKHKKILKKGFNKTTFFDIYKPLFDQTVKNILSSSPVKALTGPIERYDTDTLKMHIDYMKKYSPELHSTYVFMGIETVKTALKKKSLDSEKAANILKILNKF